MTPRAGEPIGSERARILGLLTDHLPKGVPPPSAVIDSGRGFWGLWRLAEPVVMPDADTPAWDAARASVEDRNRGLELAFGADACHNIERVMRLPGTVNRKPGAGPARIVASSAVTYRLDDFPAVPDPKAAPSAAPVAVPAAGVDVAALPVPDRLRALIVNGYDPDEPQRWPSRSEALFHAVCGMVRAGCEDEVILGVILDPDLGISGHVLAQKRPETYARRQVARARAEGDDTFDCDKEGRPLATSQRNIRVALRRLPSGPLGALFGLLSYRLGRRTVWVDDFRQPGFARMVPSGRLSKPVMAAYSIFCAADAILRRERGTVLH